MPQNLTTHNFTQNLTKNISDDGSLPADDSYEPQGPVQTKKSDSMEIDDGSVALVIIFLILIFLTICAISFHYCNFKGKERYEKLEKENELVEIDLFESDKE